MTLITNDDENLKHNVLKFDVNGDCKLICAFKELENHVHDYIVQLERDS